MALERVVTDIESAAAQEARRIEREADAEAAKILADAKAKASAIVAAAREKGRKQAEAFRAKEVASHKLSLKRAFLGARKALVDQALAEARVKIEDLGVKERKHLLSALLKSVPKGYRLHSKKEDLKLVQELTHHKPEEAAILGGVIAESEDGTLRENLSFDVFFDRAKQDSARELSKTLFGGEE
jgi:V/A-type H+-transporting ATPase subunit E